jgi:hypothetical protein
LIYQKPEAAVESMGALTLAAITLHADVNVGVFRHLDTINFGVEGGEGGDCDLVNTERTTPAGVDNSVTRWSNSN